MCVILSCPKTVKTINLRNKIELHSLSDRIKEINTALAVKLLKGRDNLVPRKDHNSIGEPGELTVVVIRPWYGF